MSVLVVAGGPADQEVLRALRFEDVTISNLDESLPADSFQPYRWSFQDAESLDYPDGAFDLVVVSAGLHHCRSPHRALLEMYRVARKVVLALESRDSLLMRAAIRLGAVDEYELTAVAANSFESGGVRNSSTPNFVYRWTEREVRKTIASHAPHARHRIVFFREFELPFSVLDLRGRPVWRLAARVLNPLLVVLTKLFPRQANLFGFAIVKPELPRDLFPWMKLTEAGPAPDEAWIRSRLRG